MESTRMSPSLAFSRCFIMLHLAAHATSFAFLLSCSASELPSPVVTLDLKEYPPYCTPMIEHNLQPRWVGGGGVGGWVGAQPGGACRLCI